MSEYSDREPFRGIDRTGFVLLTTFRRDGTPVPTTVWIVRDGERMIVTSSATAGKTKRIRATPEVTMVSSDVAGNTEPDAPVVAARARVLPREEVDALVPLFYERYGDQARQLMASHEAMFERAMIEIVPA
jgi:PPOX class probable F420-dependent enzyme